MVDDLKRVSFTTIANSEMYSKVVNNFEKLTCDIIIKESGQVFCTKESIEDFSELWDSLFVRSASDFLVNNFKKFQTTIFLELESATYKGGLMQVTTSGPNFDANSPHRYFFNLDYACICLKSSDEHIYFLKFSDSKEVRFIINKFADSQQQLASVKWKVMDLADKLINQNKEEKVEAKQVDENSKQEVTLDTIKKLVLESEEKEKEQIKQVALKNLEEKLQYCVDVKSIVAYTRSDSFFPNFKSFKKATKLAKDEIKKRGFKVRYKNTKYNFILEVYGW